MKLEIERKYLLGSIPDLSEIAAHTPVTTSVIEQRYLDAPAGSEVRIRRCDRGGVVGYTLTEKRPCGDDPAVREETECLVDSAAWRAAVAHDGPVVSKRRHVFTYQGQRFELDELLAPRQAWLLEVELADVSDEVHLPPWLDIAAEVTDDPSWRNATIAAEATSTQDGS